MNALIISRFVYNTEANILKAVHLESFSDGMMKAKIFILQVDNKIVDATGASKKRKIR